MNLRFVPGLPGNYLPNGVGSGLSRFYLGLLVHYSLMLEKGTNGVRRLSAHREPFESTGFVDFNGRRVLSGIVIADMLQEFFGCGFARVRNSYAVKGAMGVSLPGQSDYNGQK